MSVAIQVQDLAFGYTGGRMLFEGLSLAIPKGGFVGIVGPNGAGKSTFLKLICGLLAPRAGEVLIEGRPIGSYGQPDLARNLAVVGQQPFVPPGFTVIETVMMARVARLGILGFEGRADQDAADRALDLTETGHLAGRLLTSLSGGERQMVFIARALAQEAPLILLDEPTSSLDIRHQVATCDLLKRMQSEQGKTILAITHDLNLASQYCDMVLLMWREDPCPGGSSGRSDHLFGTSLDVLTPARIEQAFGVGVLEGGVPGMRCFVPAGRLGHVRELP